MIANLLERIDAKQALVDQLEKHQLDLEAEISRADAAHAELTEAHKAALLELGELRATIKFLHSEIDGLKQQVETWRSETQRLNHELKSSRRRELILLLGLIARSLL